MTARLEVVARNGRALASIEAYERRAGDLEPAMRSAAVVMRGVARRQFDSGAGWKPSRKPRGKTGIKSGALRASFTGGAGSIERATRSQLQVRSALPHAHLFTGGRPRQPARPVYRAAGSRQAVAQLRQAIVAWVLDGEQTRG